MDSQIPVNGDRLAAEPEFRTFPPAVEWGLDQLDAHEDSAPTVSVCLGLFGLGMMLAMLACVPPVAIEILNSYTNSAGPSSYLGQLAVIQMLFLPPVISGAIVVSAVFFWHVPISTRFFASMFALFIGAGIVAVTIQMWSRWTLTHLRQSDRQLPSLGTRALFELTGVTAISYAIIIGLSNDPQLTSGSSLVAMLLFSAFGGVLALAGIGMFHAFLQTGGTPFHRVLVPALFAFASASILPGFLAVSKFLWSGRVGDVLLVTAAAAFGSILIAVVAGSHLWWMRLCGWSCVNRGTTVKPDISSS